MTRFLRLIDVIESIDCDQVEVRTSENDKGKVYRRSDLYGLLIQYTDLAEMDVYSIQPSGKSIIVVVPDFILDYKLTDTLSTHVH